MHQLVVALEDADFNHPEQARRVLRLADRLAAVRQGEAPKPLEAWMEELYRRVSDRQTMGSVVQELRTSLSDAEKLIDEFFRKPNEPKPLLQVPRHLAAMRGVLSVLGMDHASAALLRMRDDIDGLASTVVDTERVTQAGVFDRIAGNLGALGFLIDMLSVQPQMAKSLFVYDAEAGKLSPVMGSATGRRFAGQPEAATPVEPRLLEQAQQLAISASQHDTPVAEVARGLERLSNEAMAADQGSLAATVREAQQALGEARTEADLDSVRGKLSDALVEFVSSRSDAVGLEPDVAALRGEAVPAPNAAASGRVPLDEGDELRLVFLEEASEVLTAAEQARAALTVSPSDVALLTTVRRSFHTLKGSSRMVGLKDFGEAAWNCERVYNTQLAGQGPADPPLLEFTQWALAYLRGWVGEIAAHRLGGHDAATVAAAVQLLGQRREEAGSQQVSDIALPLALPVIAPAISAPMELSLDFDLDLEPLAERLPDAPAGDVPASAPVPLGLATGVAGASASSRFGGLDLLVGELGAAPPSVPIMAPLSESQAMPLDASAPVSEPGEADNIKVVGPLRIGIPLFNIYLNEADELSRRLTTELAEWAMELHRPIGEVPIALAHSLAGSSATVGFTDLSNLSRTLEHSLMRSEAIGQGTSEEAPPVRRYRRRDPPHAAPVCGWFPGRRFAQAAESAGRTRDRFRTAPGGRHGCRRHARSHPHGRTGAGGAAATPPRRRVVASGPARATNAGARNRLLGAAVVAAFRIFGLRGAQGAAGPAAGAAAFGTAEPCACRHRRRSRRGRRSRCRTVPRSSRKRALELLPQLAGQLRSWQNEPEQANHASACMRTLHTLKGGARLAGAMRLGEMAHRLETRIEQLLAAPQQAVEDIEDLQSNCDALSQLFDAMRSKDAKAHADAADAIQDLSPPAGSAGARGSADAAGRACAARRRTAAAGVARVLRRRRGSARRAGRDGNGPRIAARGPSRNRLVAFRGDGQRQGRAGARAERDAVCRARARAVARPARQPGGRGEHHPLSHRDRSRPDQGLAERPDRQPRAAPAATARHRTAGRNADDLAPGGRQGRRPVVRPAGVRPLHALPGSDAHDGRVGQRRRHRAAHVAALAREHRGRAGRPGAHDARVARRPAAHPHGGVRGAVRPALPRGSPGRKGNRKAGATGYHWRVHRGGPGGAGPHDRNVRTPAAQLRDPWHRGTAGPLGGRQGPDRHHHDDALARGQRSRRRGPRRWRRAELDAHPRQGRGDGAHRARACPTPTPSLPT